MYALSIVFAVLALLGGMAFAIGFAICLSELDKDKVRGYVLGVCATGLLALLIWTAVVLDAAVS